MLGRRGGRVTTSSSPPFCGAIDGALEVELLQRSLARERAELAQGELDLAHIENEIAAVTLVGAGVGGLDSAPSS